MKQIYLFYFLLVGFLLFNAPVNAQEADSLAQIEETEMNIEDLSIYPNPAPGNKIYIRTRHNQLKEVEVYNVLGKPILQKKISGTELNISSLEKGIYFLKIKEGEKTATRKLVVR